MEAITLRRNPFRHSPFTVLGEDMGRLFERFFEHDQDPSRYFVPPMELVEETDALVLRADMPGVDPKNVDLSFDNGVLTIRGERREETKESETAHWSERRYGSFVREIRLPSYVNPEKVNASYRDGVLVIRLPKREEARPRQITINTK